MGPPELKMAINSCPPQMLGTGSNQRASLSGFLTNCLIVGLTRQQIIVLERSVTRPRIRTRDRVVFTLTARDYSSLLNCSEAV